MRSDLYCPALGLSRLAGDQKILLTARLAIVLLLLTTTSVVTAEESATRNYPLPDHGVVRLDVPKSWQEKIKQTPDKRPPTFIFTPQNGATFLVVVTPIWPAGPNVMLPSLDEIKESVATAANRVGPQSVEGSIKIRELKGLSVDGYYFSATDKAPAAGEFKYMTQGTLQLMNLLVTFSVMTNDGAENVVPATLEMLRGIIHAP